VETTETGSKLLELGCRYAQGFCIAKPMDAKELVSWVERYRIPEQWLMNGQALQKAAEQRLPPKQ